MFYILEIHKIKQIVKCHVYFNFKIITQKLSFKTSYMFLTSAIFQDFTKFIIESKVINFLRYCILHYYISIKNIIIICLSLKILFASFI